MKVITEYTDAELEKVFKNKMVELVGAINQNQMKERKLLQLFADEAMEKIEIEYRKLRLINKLKK